METETTKVPFIIALEMTRVEGGITVTRMALHNDFVSAIDEFTAGENLEKMDIWLEPTDIVGIYTLRFSTKKADDNVE